LRAFENLLMGLGLRHLGSMLRRLKGEGSMAWFFCVLAAQPRNEWGKKKGVHAGSASASGDLLKGEKGTAVVKMEKTNRNCEGGRT